MQLWGKMAAQHHAHTYQQQNQNQNQNHNAGQQQQQQLTGLATGLRPQYFASSTKQNMQPMPGSTLSVLLSGKQSGAGPLGSPSAALFGKKEVKEKGEVKEREREQQQREAMYAALASQTLLKRLGSAFWDAFSGGSGSGGGGGLGGGKSWDADKVRRVLEGKAVVRVVDVDVGHGDRKVGVQAEVPTQSQGGERKSGGRKMGGEGERCMACVSDILEESMRSLSLGKKA